MTDKNEFKRRWIELKAPEKRDLARRAGTSVPYLSLVAHGHRNPRSFFWRVLIEELNKPSESLTP